MTNETTEQQTGGRLMGIPAGTSVHPRAGADGAKAHHGVAWLVVALLGLVGFVLLTVVVASKAVLPFDAPVLAFSQSLDGVPDVWRALSESANIPLVVIGLGMVIWLFATRRRGEALIVLVMLAAVTLGSEGVKELVARPRPSGTDPNIPGVVYSFPSGHVLEALTILGMIAIRGWRSSRPRAAMTAFVVAVIIWVALVGLARMALSAHFPSDVLASVLGGGGALGVYGWLTRRGNPRPETER